MQTTLAYFGFDFAIFFSFASNRSLLSSAPTRRGAETRSSPADFFFLLPPRARHVKSPASEALDGQAWFSSFHKLSLQALRHRLSMLHTTHDS